MVRGRSGVHQPAKAKRAQGERGTGRQKVSYSSCARQPTKAKGAQRRERERETDGAAGAKTLALPDTAAVKYKSYFYGGP